MTGPTFFSFPFDRLKRRDSGGRNSVPFATGYYDVKNQSDMEAPCSEARTETIRGTGILINT